MAFRPVSDKPFAWVDTETTGLDPNKNEIIDIAIIRIERDGTQKITHNKIKMEHPENAHPKALAVNGYTEEAWAGAPTAKEVFEFIHKEGLLQDCILAGHNVSFDAGFINATFARCGIDARVDYHLYDTVTVALANLKPYLRSVSLVAVCEALGIPTDGAHTALADCRMALAVNEMLSYSDEETRARWATEIPARLAAAREKALNKN